MSKNIDTNSRTIEKLFVRDKIKTRTIKLPMIIKVFRFIFKSVGNIFPTIIGRKANEIFLTPFDKPKQVDPNHYFDSAKAQDIVINDLTIRTYSWGKGPRTILLVHGWESRSCYMTMFLPRLLEKGYKVVTFDGPAHGLSEGKMTNMVAFGEITNKIIDIFGSIESIIGHSFGGPSTVYALAHTTTPSNIKKMVIIASPNDIPGVLSRFCSFFHIPSKMQKQMILQLEKMLGHSIEKSNINYNLPKTGLESILLIHDELDETVPYQDAIDIYEANSNTSLILTKGLGHSKIKDNEDVIEKAVSFIIS